MQWQLLDYKLHDGDFVLAKCAIGDQIVEIIAQVVVDGRSAQLLRMDVQGNGRNTIGWLAPRSLVLVLMELLDVDELRVAGATRTSGANPGRRPRPVVFRRT